MQNNNVSAWDLPRPTVRLWLTLALGVLGASLLRINIEGEKVGGFHWLCIIILLLIAGASVAQLLSHPRKRDLRPWLETLLRGPAIALTAPMILFASRPAATGHTTSPRLQRLTQNAFTLFPFAVAAGLASPIITPHLTTAFPATFRQLLREFFPGFDPTLFSLAFFSFSVWAWVGCALVFVLSPSWPEHPRIPATKRRMTVWGYASLATAALAGTAVVLAVLPHDDGWMMFALFFLPWSIWGGVGVALLALLVPWPEYPPLPRLADLPTARKTGPWATAIFLAIAIAALGSIAYYPLRLVVSGQLFSDSFNHIRTSGLELPLLVFSYCSAIVLPYMAIARWMSDRSTWLGYWAFTIPASILCFLLLCILTIPFHRLIQYIQAMGFTPRRVYGLVYGLAGYIGILLFLCWAVWPPNATSRIGLSLWNRYRGLQSADCAD